MSRLIRLAIFALFAAAQYGCAHAGQEPPTPAPAPATLRVAIAEVKADSLLRGLARASGAKFADEVEAIVHTGVFSSRLTNLDGVGQFHNLRFLNLPSHWIHDLTPLSALDNLESLYLNDNRLDSLAPLASLSRLESLHVCHNHIDDLRPLAPLAGKLTQLVLSFNRLGDDDLAVISGLTKLEILALEGNALTDVRPLASLTHLKRLYLSDNAISDVAPLAALRSLEVLYLTNNAVSTGVAKLAVLSSLAELDLRGNTAIPCRDLQTLEAALKAGVVTRPETCAH